MYYNYKILQFSSVAQSCPTLCDPMNHSTPGVRVQLPESTQTHVHQVDDAIQQSHPLSSPSPPTFNLFQPQGLSIESILHIRWPKDWSFSFNISPPHPYMTTGKTTALTRRTFVDKVMSLLLNMLSRLVITFLPRSKCLLISWLH